MNARSLLSMSLVVVFATVPSLSLGQTTRAASPLPPRAVRGCYGK